MLLLRVKKSRLLENVNHVKNFILTIKPCECLKFIVLTVCFVMVYVQLKECWSKVKNPPVITHTKLIMNETVSYPALTICREPPYNKIFYKQFNFSGLHLGSYPITSHWKDFPYDTYNISDFWNVAVYNKGYMLCNSLSDLPPSQIDIQSSIHLTTGMCHTIRPKKTVATIGKKPGYHILLMHDLYNYDPFQDKEAGWYIYLHEVKEKFSENINIYSGRQAHIFVPVGEKVEVNLDAYQFTSIHNCNNTANYTFSECEENCWVQKMIKPNVNCSGPWLPSLNKPYCNEPNGMIDLVKTTLLMDAGNCCQKSCQTTQYKTSIIKRSQYPPQRKLTSGARIYFTSKAAESLLLRKNIHMIGIFLLLILAVLSGFY